MKILKFLVAMEFSQSIEMPQGAQILDVQLQGGRPVMWALCDQRRAPANREFAMYSTGGIIPEFPGKYIATFQLDNGLAYHIFEV